MFQQFVFVRHVIDKMQTLFNIGVFFFLLRNLDGFWIVQNIACNTANIAV